MNIEIKMDEIPPATESVTYGIDLQVLEDKEVYDSVDNYDPHSFYVWKKTTSTLWSFLSETLDPVNRDIVLRRVVDEQSFVAIGKLYGLSSDAIRERYLKSMRKLRRRILRDEYEYINNIHLNFILDDIEYLPTTLDTEDLDQYKQYMIRNPKPCLVKPAKPAKPKAKKRKKPVVSEPPVVVSEPPVVDDKVDQKEQEPIDDNNYLKAYVVGNTHPVLVRFERVNGSLSYMVFKKIHCNVYRMLIDSVNVQLESCNVRIAVYSPFPDGYQRKQDVDINLDDFLNNLGIDCDVHAKSKLEIATTILRCLQGE